MEKLSDVKKNESITEEQINATKQKGRKNAQKSSKKSKPTSSKKLKAKTKQNKSGANLAYPRHSISKVIRIPKAIIEQNAGRECTDKEAAQFVGVGLNGSFRVEISSAKKYGLIESTGTSKIKPTELAKKIIRPQSHDDELAGLREAVTNAPTIGDVYKHYRGENLPDNKFLKMP